MSHATGRGKGRGGGRLFSFPEEALDLATEPKHDKLLDTMNCCVPANDRVDGAEACANCGAVSSDTVKLKNCNACRLVKYCGVDCQKAHRKQHKKACKQRAAELQDEQLYGQGKERPEGDFCPICTLPIPLPMHHNSVFTSCCMKRVCYGCDAAAKKRGMRDCPFCRTPAPYSDPDTFMARVRARVKNKDPVAINNLGEDYQYGRHGLEKDMQKAVELWTEAAELGSIRALYNLGYYYGAEYEIQEDREKLLCFTKKLPCKDTLRAGITLDVLRDRRGTTTVH